MKRVRSTTTKKIRKKKVPAARPLDRKRTRVSQAGSPKSTARSGVSTGTSGAQTTGTWVDPLTPAERMERNRRAAALLRKWMEEDPDYDEQVGAALEAMGEYPVRFREDFD